MSAPLEGVALLDALEGGSVRAAERSPDGRWSVNTWVKEAILRLFKTSPVIGQVIEAGAVEGRTSELAWFAYRDKAPLSVRRFGESDGVRLVPGGSAVRRGAHLSRGVVCMPPMYVNIGAWVGEDTMIDSHVLVGSCAQIGARVHLSAGAQIGGVLEPANARPVIVEDGAFVGGNTGLYEGVLVREGAVIAAGTILTASTRVYDLVHERELTGARENPLEIPPRAVVVPGSRPARTEYAGEHGLHLACALIVKYRDERTDAATALESALR
jgi:2,3,4,5-tetrahydropyridine-2-carboxylate N-succinyltransferase